LFIEGIGSRSRTRATLVALLVLTLAATLLAADSASAQTLSSKRAKAMAGELLDQQLRDRDRRLLEARISTPRRVSRRVIRFLYDDLNRQGVICTGVIEVRRTGRRFIARFRTSDCEQPGDEVLAFRAQARVVETRVIRKARSVERSVTRFARDTRPCDRLRVPDARVDEATLLLSTGLAQATTRPLWGTLSDYAKTLQALEPADPELAAGANAWRAYNDTVQSLPVLQGGYCAALVQWSRNGYSEETAPVDFPALRTTAARLRAAGAQVRRTARYLRAQGVDPLTASAFTLDNLIGQTAITEIPARPAE
jgi:hypothetical protein